MYLPVDVLCTSQRNSDELEYEKQHNLITPLMGAVYYGMDHKFNEGTGLLHLIDADVEDNPLDFEYERRNEVVEVRPLFNRMIIFNASKWHRGTYLDLFDLMLVLSMAHIIKGLG
jgi:hypothetical protein